MLASIRSAVGIWWELRIVSTCIKTIYNSSYVNIVSRLLALDEFLLT